MNKNRRRNPYLKFKSFLFEQGVSQNKLAEILGKTPSSISSHINGTGGDFSLQDIRIICKHFKISADEYFIEF